MKAKALVLAVAAILSVSTLAACSDSDQKITFNDSWQYNTLAVENVDETCTYKVTYEKGSGMGMNYTVSYEEGSYVTALKSSSDRYTYTTSLSIPVTYTLGEETETFHDVVTTETVFLRASGGLLRPVSSKKTMESHTPNNASAAKLDGCYAHFKYTVTTTYEETGKGSASVVYEETNASKAHTKTTEFSYGGGKYSWVDNEQLLLALRAVPTANTSGKLSVYNPSAGKAQSVAFSFETKTAKEFTHTVNGNPLAIANISYRPVTIKLSERNPGATQTAWIASKGEDTKNANRNVLLRLETPLSYNLGTLIYTLTSIQQA